MRVVGLKVDYLDEPLGLENASPRFSWRLESDKRNVRQSAFRILVASTELLLRDGQGDLWDSGKVSSARSFGHQYKGRKLISRQRCWWRAEVWVADGGESALGATTWWEMGLLHPQDWAGAHWLAVEDQVLKADREAGLTWIWGQPSSEQIKRGFRFTFHLPADCSDGELFAVVNNWMWSAQIPGIWIDGIPYSGASDRQSTHNFQCLGVSNLSGQRIRLKGLGAGEHLFAIEVNAFPQDTSKPDRISANGLALLARLPLTNGETLRVGSGPSWKTSVLTDEDWYKPRYDDRTWETVEPAPIEGFQPMPPLPAFYVRRAFTIEGRLDKARLYATALGAYQARINGERVDNSLLAPELTQYHKRVFYRVYDVTSMLRQGRNSIGITVGDGWYASFEGRFAWGLPPRRLLALLEMTFSNGNRQTIGTGPGWRAMESPIRESEIRIGEIFDARLEQVGWDTPEFDDSKWRELEVTTPPRCQVVAQLTPPIRVTEVLKPHAVSEPRLGVYVFDFGQNFAGWCRLHVNGARGQRIELRFSELLTASGLIDTSFYDMGEPKRDIYILKGDPAGETFEPHFTYRGFRYVQVTGLSSTPTLESLEGAVVHSDLAVTGRFRSDSQLMKRIWQNSLWSQRANFVGIATDCPSREQRGWMGDACVFWSAAAFNMDVSAFTARRMDDIVNDQAPSGAFTRAAPEPLFNNGTGDSCAVWSDAGITLPWIAWRHYGDISIIERNWDAMTRYLRLVEERNPRYIRYEQNSGNLDELSLDSDDQKEFLKIPSPSTPSALVATAYWARSVTLLADMAKAIGRNADAEHWEQVFQQIREAFNEAFVKTDGTIGTGSQTGYILALQFGLLPQDMRQAVANRLVSEIRHREVALTTGIVGTQFSLDALADAGYGELAYSLLLKSDYPSWGYMISQGATTMWEGWSGEAKIDGKIKKLSQNHFFFGSVCKFLFSRIAGIDATAPGFEQISIRPLVDGRVKFAGGDYDSIMGTISTDWAHASNGDFNLDVTIPSNACAIVALPARKDDRIEEGGKDISHCSEVTLVRRLDHDAIVTIGSGTYRFSVHRYSTSLETSAPF